MRVAAVVDLSEAGGEDDDFELLRAIPQELIDTWPLPHIPAQTRTRRYRFMSDYSPT